MNQMENISYEGVLKIVSHWPIAQQIALVEDVLRTISSRVEPPKQRRRTLDQALGLLATDKPAPTDEEVEQWLDMPLSRATKTDFKVLQSQSSRPPNC